MKIPYFFILFALTISKQSFAQYSTIKGEILNSKVDSIKLVLSGNGITKKTVNNKIAVVNGKFQSKFKISNPTYFYITDEVNYIGGLAEPDDNFTISYDLNNVFNTLKIEGKGSEKVSFSNRLNQLKPYKLIQRKVLNAIANNYPFDYLFNCVDSIGNVLLNELNAIKGLMKPQSYDLLLADIKATTMSTKYRSVGLLYHEGIDETLKKRKNQLTNSSYEYLRNILQFDSTLFKSASYTTEVFNILYAHHSNLLSEGKVEPGIANKYNYLEAHLPYSLRPPVFANFIQSDLYNIKNNEEIEELKKVIANTYSRVIDSLYRNNFESKLIDLTSLKSGMKAPDFILENEKGEKVSLSHFAGKVIFLDFWYAACGPCHLLFEDLKPLKKLYAQNENVVFLSISIDSKETWVNALKKYNIAGHHLFIGDLGMKNPIIESYKVNGYPSTYIIDAKGNIFSSHPSRKINELQEEIEAALKQNTK